ncbi:hypothetical protein FRB94_012560 [Tulasnella sp. JGI-2019a]|nr:hypothetical protein FRB94_012560 [Tulasnella sp. JGI-2019a]
MSSLPNFAKLDGLINLVKPTSTLNLSVVRAPRCGSRVVSRNAFEPLNAVKRYEMALGSRTKEEMVDDMSSVVGGDLGCTMIRIIANNLDTENPLCLQFSLDVYNVPGWEPIDWSILIRWLAMSVLRVPDSATTMGS